MNVRTLFYIPLLYLFISLPWYKVAYASPEGEKNGENKSPRENIDKTQKKNKTKSKNEEEKTQCDNIRFAWPECQECQPEFIGTDCERCAPYFTGRHCRESIFAHPSGERVYHLRDENQKHLTFYQGQGREQMIKIKRLIVEPMQYDGSAGYTLFMIRTAHQNRRGRLPSRYIDTGTYLAKGQFRLRALLLPSYRLIGVELSQIGCCISIRNLVEIDVINHQIKPIGSADKSSYDFSAVSLDGRKMIAVYRKHFKVFELGQVSPQPQEQTAKPLYFFGKEKIDCTYTDIQSVADPLLSLDHARYRLEWLSPHRAKLKVRGYTEEKHHVCVDWSVYLLDLRDQAGLRAEYKHIEAQALAQYHAEVEREWRSLSARKQAELSPDPKEIRAFLRRYKHHPLGNPFQAAAQDLLMQASMKLFLSSSNPAGIEWVWIPGGNFVMGSSVSTISAEPVHRVTLDGFWMAKTEVTVGQYRRCVEAGVCVAEAVKTCEIGALTWTDQPEHNEDRPIVCIDWVTARRFAHWAGGELPTESEWAYAAQSAGMPEWRLPWGNTQFSCEHAVVSYSEGGICDHEQAEVVCSKTKGNTRQGLCDMVGNVWEYVLDEWQADYVNAPLDGRPACASPDCLSPTLSPHVIRGGGVESDRLHIAIREAAPRPNSQLGFRVRKRFTVEKDASPVP